MYRCWSVAQSLRRHSVRQQTNAPRLFVAPQVLCLFYTLCPLSNCCRCVNLCKSPVQTFFTEQLGMPLTMNPNFDDFSCEVSWEIW